MPVAFWKKTPARCDAPPVPAVPCVALSGFAFSQAINLRQILRRHGFLGDDEERLGGDQRHRLEVVQQVVGEREDRGVQDVRGPAAENERVAVGRRAGDPADAEIAGGAANVFDDDRIDPATPRMPSAMMRPIVSVEPPAGNGTTIVTGRDG